MWAVGYREGRGGHVVSEVSDRIRQQVGDIKHCIAMSDADQSQSADAAQRRGHVHRPAKSRLMLNMLHARQKNLRSWPMPRTCQ